MDFKYKYILYIYIYIFILIQIHIYNALCHHHWNWVTSACNLLKLMHHDGSMNWWVDIFLEKNKWYQGGHSLIHKAFMRLRDTSLFPRMHHSSEKSLICLCQGQKCFKQKNVIWSNFQGRSHVLDTVLDPRICYWQSWKIKKAKLWRQSTREAKVSRSTHSKIYRYTLLQHMQINYPKARNGGLEKAIFNTHTGPRNSTCSHRSNWSTS